VRQCGRYGESRASDPSALAHLSCRQRVTFLICMAPPLGDTPADQTSSFPLFVLSAFAFMQGAHYLDLASDLAKC
jgi:hypothetical protein